MRFLKGMLGDVYIDVERIVDVMEEKREEVGDLHSKTYTLKLELSSEGRERRVTRRRMRGLFKVEPRNEEG